MFDQDLLRDIDLRKGEGRLHECGLSIDNPGDNLLLRPLCSDDYEKGKCCFCHDSDLQVLFTLYTLMQNFVCFAKKSVNRKPFLV